MTNDKVNQVLREISMSLAHGGFIAVRAPASIALPVQNVALAHARWMVREALTFPAEKLEKKMRWLGFVQGVLWAHGGQSIEALKQQNMPDDEKHSRGDL